MYNLIALILVYYVRHLVDFHARFLRDQFRLPTHVYHVHAFGAGVHNERNRHRKAFRGAEQNRYVLLAHAAVHKVELGRQRHKTVRHQDEHLEAEHGVDRFGYVAYFVMDLADFRQLLRQTTVGN